MQNDTRLKLAAALPPLVAHEEIQRRTLTENPLVLLQTRPIDTLSRARHLLGEIIEREGTRTGSADELEDQLEQLAGWQTERVFIDPIEAERFVSAQRHRYPVETADVDWRFHTGIADGILRDVAKAARDAANA